jgi:hypothetical protein
MGSRIRPLMFPVRTREPIRCVRNVPPPVQDREFGRGDQPSAVKEHVKRVLRQLRSKHTSKFRKATLPRRLN